jgi:predicted enzyme related to lactoylglutathione lyase
MQFSFARAFVSIAAIDWHKSVAFYQALSQAPPIVLMADRYAEFELAGLRIGIYSPRRIEQVFPDPHPRLSLCLEVRRLEAALEHLRDLGELIPSGIHQVSHGREVYAYDPDGNRLILYEPHLGQAAQEPRYE